MELNNLRVTSTPITKTGDYEGGTPGLSSPDQLFSLASSITVNLDQSAAGTELVVFGSQSPNHATKVAQIRQGSFERLGEAWRILANR
jgi:G:T/U-mismatch repair DNA glycosylase